MKLIYPTLTGLSTAAVFSFSNIKQHCNAEIADFLKQTKGYRSVLKCYNIFDFYKELEEDYQTEFEACYAKFVAKKAKKMLRRGFIDQETFDEGESKVRQCFDLFVEKHNHDDDDDDDDDEMLNNPPTTTESPNQPRLTHEKFIEHLCSEDETWHTLEENAYMANIARKAVSIIDHHGRFLDVHTIAAGAELHISTPRSSHGITVNEYGKPPQQFIIDPHFCSQTDIRDDSKRYWFSFFIRSAANPNLCLDVANYRLMSGGVAIQLGACLDVRNPNDEDLYKQLWSIMGPNNKVRFWHKLNHLYLYAESSKLSMRDVWNSLFDNEEVGSSQFEIVG